MGWGIVAWRGRRLTSKTSEHLVWDLQYERRGWLLEEVDWWLNRGCFRPSLRWGNGNSLLRHVMTYCDCNCPTDVIFVSANLKRRFDG